MATNRNKVPSIEMANLRGKRVLIRVDFNVPMKGERIIDDLRIKLTLPTIKYVYKNGGIPLLITHLEPVVSVKPVMRHCEKLLKHKVEYLENIRMHKEEKDNDIEFARRLSRFGDIYINEAFSVSHRRHASLVSLPKFLPSYAGFQFLKEIKILSEALDPPRPMTLILGGAKFTTKIGVLDKFHKKANDIFICGALANTFLAAKGFEVGKSLVEYEYIKRMRKYLKNKHIHLPVEVVVEKKKAKFVEDVHASDRIVDLGKKSLAEIAQNIKKAKMVLWNGTLGIEEEGYTEGSIGLLKILAKSKAKIIIGGGDTDELVDKRHMKKAFYHVSSGGGAMLEFLGTGTLPGLIALNSRDR